MVKKNKRKEIALERIHRLFELAEQEFEKKPERSKRYIELARKIGTRNRTVIPTELKKKFCKKCGAFLKKGQNAEQIQDKEILKIKCKECGHESKKPAKQAKKEAF